MHGANRLASNSLLEGMVFGARLAESIQVGADGPEPSGVMEALLGGPLDRVDPAAASPWRTAPAGDGEGADVDVAVPTWPDVQKTRDRLQRVMIEGAGVVRSARSLASAGAAVEALQAEMGDGTPTDRDHGELANLATAALSVLRAATLREETRGAHARSDHPDASDRWRRRIVHDASGVSVQAGPTTPSPAGRPSR